MGGRGPGHPLVILEDVVLQRDGVATLHTAHGGQLESLGVAGGADLLSDEGEVGSDGSTLHVLLLGGVVRLVAPPALLRLVAPAVAVLAFVASRGKLGTSHVSLALYQHHGTGLCSVYRAVLTGGWWGCSLLLTRTAQH